MYQPVFLSLGEYPRTFVDGGAFTGDLGEALLKGGASIREWIAFEPDGAISHVYVKLQRAIAQAFLRALRFISSDCPTSTVERPSLKGVVLHHGSRMVQRCVFCHRGGTLG